MNCIRENNLAGMEKRGAGAFAQQHFIKRFGAAIASKPNGVACGALSDARTRDAKAHEKHERARHAEQVCEARRTCAKCALGLDTRSVLLPDACGGVPAMRKRIRHRPDTPKGWEDWTVFNRQGNGNAYVGVSACLCWRRRINISGTARWWP